MLNQMVTNCNWCKLKKKNTKITKYSSLQYFCAKTIYIQEIQYILHSFKLVLPLIL